jgi:hypothetical protein
MIRGCVKGLGNKSEHSRYDGTDEVTLVDGSGLEISHTSSVLPFFNI